MSRDSRGPVARSSLRCLQADDGLGDAPILVIGVGNPSRGDDAIGPRVIAGLQAWQDAGRLAGVALLSAFQLQPEHVLDLAARRRIIVVDAAVGLAEPCRLAAVGLDAADRARAGSRHGLQLGWTSHQLGPSALLALYRALYGEPPRLELLAVGAQSFDLGADLSATARANLGLALERLRVELAVDGALVEAAQQP